MNPIINQAGQVAKEIYIECRPETLFSFFTDPDKMVRWMGKHVLLEPAIGGKFRIDLNGSDIAIGEYIEIVPHEKIVMTWGWEKSKLVPPGSSTLAFLLSAKDSGTLLKLNHYGLPTEEEVASHVKGWNHYMDRLHDAAVGSDLEVDPGSCSAAKPS